jgi:ATP-dependent Clp protease ATP-binding subunit ClpA
VQDCNRYHGYLVEATRVTGDLGVDLVARRYAEILAVQCKRLASPVGAKAVEEVAAGAAMYGCTSSMVVSNQSFTARAIALAKRHNCVLIDGAELSRLAAGWRPDTNEAERQIEHSDDEMKTPERYNLDARVALALAEEWAYAMETGSVGAEHLLLGVLENAGHHLSSVLRDFGLTAEVIRDRLTCAESSPDRSFEDYAQALRSIGIDLRAIRDNIDGTFGPGTYENALPKYGRRRRGHAPFTKPAKKVLELSLREALAHKDNWIGCEHIILAILRGGDKSTLGLITEQVDTAQLRAAVIGLLDEAA